MVLAKYEGDCRGSVLMVETGESYHSSGRYVISDSHFFDNNRQADFFDSYAPQTARAGVGLVKLKVQAGHN